MFHLPSHVKTRTQRPLPVERPLNRVSKKPPRERAPISRSTEVKALCQEHNLLRLPKSTSLVGGGGVPSSDEWEQRERGSV